MTCVAEWKKLNLVGNKNPRWNSRPVQCDHCGKNIFVNKSIMEKTKHHFCDKSCFYSWKKENALYGKNAPNWKSIKKNCDFCGKKIYVTPYRLKLTKLHFCNKACFDDWERINKPRGKESPVWNSISVNCKNCEKEILAQPSKLKLVKDCFCSNKCHADWQRQNGPHGKEHPNWKQKSLICDFCGKKISRSPAFIKNHNFCNTFCYYEWKRRNTPKGKDHPLWKEKITVCCAYCNKTICVKPSLIRIGINNFCNMVCSTNWKREHYPKGTNNPFFKQKKIQCASCGKEIWFKAYRLKKFNNHFCNNDCYFKWLEVNGRPSGKDSPFWDGGVFYHYGRNWLSQKRNILKRANHVSELSGNNGGKMGVHHIIPVRNFIRKFIDFGLKDIPFMEISSFKVLPYDLIPSVIFEEANSDENLIYLTQSEHTKFEGMPLSFFAEIKRLNAEGV